MEILSNIFIWFALTIGALIIGYILDILLKGRVVKFIKDLLPDSLERLGQKALKSIMRNSSKMVCIQANEINKYLNKIYSSHNGEIWLYNNDLLMFEDSERFIQLYQNIFDKSKHIQKVKVIISDEVWEKIFNEDGIIKELYFNNLKNLKSDKIESLLFQKLSNCPLGGYEEAQVKGLQTSNWIFYAVSEKYLRQNKVICMIRPISFPYAMHRKSADDDLLLLFTREMNEDIFIRVTDYFHFVFNEIHFKNLKVITNDSGNEKVKILLNDGNACIA